MKQKVIKYHSDLFNQEVTIKVDDSLNMLKGKILAHNKLIATNKALKKLSNSPAVQL